MLSGKMNHIKFSTEEEQNRIVVLSKDIILQKQQIMNYKRSRIREYNSIIPLKIYQTWHTKNLPLLMRQNIQKIRRSNPRFEYFLFDDNDCREFIKNNFDSIILNAFDSLIPGAYKADLWRYCVLYINGGFYLDIKYSGINNFRFIELSEKEQWVLDIDGNNIYNAFIATLPKNELLLKCINQIVENVKNKYYGGSCVDPTGPGLVSSLISDVERTLINLSHIHNNGNKFILYKNVAILKMYNGYYEEQNKFKRVAHYVDLWCKKRIYK